MYRSIQFDGKPSGQEKSLKKVKPPMKDCAKGWDPVSIPGKTKGRVRPTTVGNEFPSDCRISLTKRPS